MTREVKSVDWFRLYDEIIDDPKIIGLAPGLRWYYIATMSVSNRQDKRGSLPDLAALSIHLRLSQAKTLAALERFAEVGLLDKSLCGQEFAIHGWDKRQRKSDDVAERVARWRENNPVTLQKRNSIDTRVRITETETETEGEGTPRTLPLPSWNRHQQECIDLATQRWGASNGDYHVGDLLKTFHEDIVMASMDAHWDKDGPNFKPRLLRAICQGKYNDTIKKGAK